MRKKPAQHALEKAKASPRFKRKVAKEEKRLEKIEKLPEQRINSPFNKFQV